MLCPILHWGLKSSHNFYRASTPKKTEMLAVSWWATSLCCVEWAPSLKIHKILEKPVQEQNCPCIYSQHISVLMGTQITHCVGTYPRTLPSYQGSMSRLPVYCTDHASSITDSICSLLWCTSFAPAAAVNTAVPQQVLKEEDISPLGLVVILLTTTTYWSCKQGVWTTHIQFNSSNRHHKGDRINFQKTNFNQNKKIVDH